MAAAALQALRDLYDKVAQREARLAELGAKKVTRALAEKHPDLRPLVALFSECHELFGHEQFGKEAADLAVQTMRRGRKTAITLAFDTQSSRADAIPPKIVELVKVNACFAVKSWRSNDGFLGTEKVSAADVPPRLRKLAPDHLPYRSMSGVQLRELLAEQGVTVPSTKRRYPVDPAAIRARLADRARDDAPDLRGVGE